MSAAELKPCPFCGGEAKEWTDSAMIACESGCGVEVHGASPYTARRNWNRRSPTVPGLPEGDESTDGNVPTEEPKRSIWWAGYRTGYERGAATEDSTLPADIGEPEPLL